MTFSIMSFTQHSNIECRYSEFHDNLNVLLSVVMLNIVRLSVVMLNVVILSVAAPLKQILFSRGEHLQQFKGQLGGGQDLPMFSNLSKLESLLLSYTKLLFSS